MKCWVSHRIRPHLRPPTENFRRQEREGWSRAWEEEQGSQQGLWEARVVHSELPEAGSIWETRTPTANKMSF